MTDTAEATSEVTGGEATTEFVPVTEATDDELKSFLESAKSGKAEEQGAEVDAKPEAKPKETGQAKETKQDEEEDSEEPVTVKRSELRRLQEERDQLAAQRKQQETFIQRRNTELGELRKQNLAYKKQLEDGLNDKFQEAPNEALKDARTIQQIEQNLEQIDHEEGMMNHVMQTYSYVQQHVDLNDVKVDDVRTALKEKGADEAYIEQFVKNPWAHATGDALVHFFDSVKYQSVLRKMVPAMKRLMSENEELKSKPQKLVQQIAKTSAQSNGVTGSSGNAAPKRGLADIDPSKLSDQDLDEVARQLGIRA